MTSGVKQQMSSSGWTGRKGCCAEGIQVQASLDGEQGEEKGGGVQKKADREKKTHRFVLLLYIR